MQRGKKVGGALAESYLHYAPALGYRGSVFNLVYSSEWLGFARVSVCASSQWQRSESIV